MVVSGTKDFLGRIFTRRFFHNPLFVVGASRSGTTVLLQALGKHPYILSMRGEAPFITSAGGAAYLFEFAENKEYYLDSIKISKEFLYDYLRRISFEVVAGKNYGLKMIVEEIIKSDLSFVKKRYWCAKTFPNLTVSKGLMQLYPNTKFIYIIRNGCNVVQSMSKFSGFRHLDFAENCRAWVKSAESFDYLRDAEFGILVRHEQLVKEPEEVFQKVFSFIGIDYHENSANFIKNTLVHPLDKPTQANINVKNTLSSRRPSYEDWTPEHCEIFKNICGDVMSKLGYNIPF